MFGICVTFPPLLRRTCGAAPHFCGCGRLRRPSSRFPPAGLGRPAAPRRKKEEKSPSSFVRLLGQRVSLESRYCSLDGPADSEPGMDARPHSPPTFMHTRRSFCVDGNSGLRQRQQKASLQRGQWQWG
eukprot:gene17049-biopygen15873